MTRAAGTPQRYADSALGPPTAHVTPSHPEHKTAEEAGDGPCRFVVQGSAANHQTWQSGLLIPKEAPGLRFAAESRSGAQDSEVANEVLPPRAMCRELAGAARWQLTGPARRPNPPLPPQQRLGGKVTAPKTPRLLSYYPTPLTPSPREGAPTLSLGKERVAERNHHPRKQNGRAHNRHARPTTTQARDQRGPSANPIIPVFTLPKQTESQNVAHSHVFRIPVPPETAPYAARHATNASP